VIVLAVNISALKLLVPINFLSMMIVNSTKTSVLKLYA